MRVRNLLAMLTATCLLAGCGTVNTYTATVAKKPGVAPYTSQINDVLTSIFLKADAVRFARTAGGPYQVQVTVANDGFSYRSFAYIFQWLDENGMQLDSGSTWQAVSVPAGGTIVISSVAPNETTETFQLQVRRRN